MRVYHRTTEYAAGMIRLTGLFKSMEEGEVCVSNRRDGYATGYGDAVITLDIPDELLTLDDEFQDGEQHFRVDAKDITREMIREES